MPKGDTWASSCARCAASCPRHARHRPARSIGHTLLARAQRIHAQQPKDKNKLYALHAPEVECIGKGKARQPYEFGAKVSLAVTHKRGLMVGARSSPGNPYDGRVLSAQLEQTRLAANPMRSALHAIAKA